MTGSGIYEVAGAVGASIAASLIGLFGARINQWLEKRKRKLARPVEDNGERDRQIRQILHSVCDHFDANRVYVTRYHNGSNFLGGGMNGGGIYLKTRTYEVISDGSSYQAQRFAAIVSTRMGEENDLVAEPGAGYRIVRELPQSEFRFLCERGRAKAVARAAIKKAGNIVGFVGIDFDNENKPEDLLSVINNAAWRIAELLP